MEQKSKIDDVEGGGGGVVKSVALQAVAASAVLCGGVSGAAEIRYALDKPAFVTIAVEDASGRRVRNLVSAQRRSDDKELRRFSLLHKILCFS